MKSFTDNLGRTWTLVVNVAAIKRVRALCGVDLNAIVEIDKNNNPTAELLERLSTDPVLLVDVLYAVCKPECDSKNITDEDFGAAMAGDAIEQATAALLDEVVDFFPTAKRAALQKILAATRRIEALAKKKLEDILESAEFEEKLVSELERSTGLSSSVQASAE